MNELLSQSLTKEPNQLQNQNVNPIMMVSQLKAVAGLIGADGSNNLIKALIDVYLTSSEQTSRSEPQNPNSLLLVSILPEAPTAILSKAFGWLDVAVASGIISEKELEEWEASDQILNVVESRLK